MRTDRIAKNYGQSRLYIAGSRGYFRFVPCDRFVGDAIRHIPGNSPSFPDKQAPFRSQGVVFILLTVCCWFDEMTESIPEVLSSTFGVSQPALGSSNESSLKAMKTDKEIEKLVIMFGKNMSNNIKAETPEDERPLQHLPPPVRFRK
jgi:hypothetical protein